MENEKHGFEISDIPNAFIGVLWIRTEKEVPTTLIKKDGSFEIREIHAHTELSPLQEGELSARIGSLRFTLTKQSEIFLRRKIHVFICMRKEELAMLSIASLVLLRIRLSTRHS